MKVTLERLNESEVKLDIELEAERVGQAFQAAYRQMVKRVNIPGFRKGKAPRPILERFLGKDALAEEAANLLVQEAYREALKETGIRPVDQGRIEEAPAVEENLPYRFEARVTVRPEVTLGDYRRLRSAPPEVTVSEEEIDREIEHLRRERAELVPDEDEVVKADSFVLVDVRSTRESGEVVEDVKGSLWNLGAEGPEEVKTSLLGCRPGDVREVEWEPPNLGEKLRSRITVQEVKRIELPPVDDEFARALGGFGGLQELRNDVANVLRKHKEDEARREHRDKILSSLREESRVSIPEVMIRNRIEWIVEETSRELAAERSSLDAFLAERRKTLDAWREELRTVAESQLKNELILEKIADEEGIEVLPGEIEERADLVFGKKRKPLGEAEREVLMEELKQEKALNFLLTPAAEKE